MKAERLLEAFGQLEEQYIEEAAPDAHKAMRLSKARKSAAAAAALLLIFAGVFGTAMVASAGFRQMVLSFFHIGQVESAPDHNGDAFHISKADIGGLVKAEYVQLGDSYYDSGFGTLYQVDRKENGAIGSVRFWAIEDGNAIALETQKNSFSANWQGNSYQGDLYWCTNDGSLSLYWDEDFHYLSETNYWFAHSVSGRTDVALLYLSQGKQRDYAQYPLLYHLDTGEVEDILQGTGAEALSFAYDHQWSDDLSKVILTCRDANDKMASYFCDVAAKSLVRLPTLTGVETERAIFADDDTLLLVQATEDWSTCSVFSYDLTAAALTQTLCQEKIFEEYRDFSMENYGMMFFGGRYGLYVDPTGILSVVDLKTGDKTPVNNFTFDPRGGFLSNFSNTKLLYSVSETLSEESPSISQLGVLNLESKTFTVFDRKDNENLEELSISWFDDDRVQIDNSQSDTYALYLYQF